MTDEAKALVERMGLTLGEWLVDEAPNDWWEYQRDHMKARDLIETQAREIEQHEAYKREVSDAIDSSVLTPETEAHLSRFIIAKPDPLVEAMRDACRAQGLATEHTLGELTKHLRAAIEKRGGKIVWGEG